MSESRFAIDRLFAPTSSSKSSTSHFYNICIRYRHHQSKKQIHHCSYVQVRDHQVGRKDERGDHRYLSSRLPHLRSSILICHLMVDQATVLYAKEVRASKFPLRVVIAKENSPTSGRCLYQVAYTAHVVVNVTGVSSEWLPLLSTQKKGSVLAGLEILLDMLQEMMAPMLGKFGPVTRLHSADVTFYTCRL